MWSVTLMGNGEYVADRRMRELGRRLCDECPLQPKCLADALTAPPARDWNITGGLTYRERLMLAQRAAEHFGVPPGDLQQVPALTSSRCFSTGRKSRA